MSKYPGSEREPRIAADALQAIVAGIFERCGMRTDDAALLADSLVQADLRSIHSHGVLRVPEYAKKLTAGGVDARGRPSIVREFAACAVIDGGNSMGQIGGAFAMQEAIRRADIHGAGFTAIGGSNHCGALDYFAMMALPHDMIGIATTNALPTMAPWGGVERMLGMNPLGVAIPAGAEDPIVLDTAFAMSAHGKIRVYQQKGYALPEGWIYDRDGNPSTNPADALHGLIAPVGAPSAGHKGTGLALVMGVLSSFLSGAAFGLELGNLIDGPHAGRDGHFFGALKVAAFQPVDVFKARVDQLVREIRTSKPAPGNERVYAPGGMEAEAARRHAREGIALNRETLAGLAATAREHGVDISALEALLRLSVCLGICWREG